MEENIVEQGIKQKGYRLSSDDNIVFLQEIAKNRPRSLFEHPYLALYKRVHEDFGAKVVLNLFYDNSTSKGFLKDRGYFDLSQMPDIYKKEWEENADWLKLSFHALREFPEFPYKSAKKEKVLSDVKKVHGEILRFAGERSLSSFATVHYGEIGQEGLDVLQSAGYSGFCGYFDAENGAPSVAYGKSEAFCRKIGQEKILKDGGTVFAKIDLCMNLAKTASENREKLEKLMQKERFGFFHIMIHEQYFYRDYAAYIEEYGEIVSACCRMLFEGGYHGAFYDEFLRRTD